MTKLDSAEKMGFFYITLVHFAFGLIVAVDTSFAIPFILVLSAIYFALLMILDYAIWTRGLDVIFKKKEAKQ
jgi:hypothetical protein